jgi:hypothetical protein
MMAAYGATAGVLTDSGPRPVSRGLRRLALLYVWIAVASIGIVVSDPAPYDALMMGAAVLLPVLGLAPFTRGIALYLLLWAAIIAGGFVATTQATSVDVPASHMGITLYLAVTSAALAAFVASRPASNVRLIMSAYVVSALVAAVAGLVGYFNLLPGAYDLFTEYGRARGTFKDANVLGAFLVPALLYAFNVVLTGRFARASLWMAAMPILLFGVLLTFSRGAWINLAVSLALYAYFTFGTAGTHRQRLKLVVYVVMAAVLAVGVFAAAQSIPKVADLMGERAALEQSYDSGPEGRFGGQQKAAGLIVTHPLGIGALEFNERYHHEDVHEVYLSMFLNAGWLGGTLYLAVVLLTIGLGLRQVVRDRGGDGISNVLVAAFIGMALEGLVIDSDHWRHFYLVMALVWGMAGAGAFAAPGAGRLPGRRAPGEISG